MAHNKAWKWPSSQLTALKDQISQRDFKSVLSNGNQALGQWALRRRNSGEDAANQEIIKVSLFPGWATRRYQMNENVQTEEFSVDVFVSGFATSHKPPETRAQRAFMRLARGFASLPKVSAPSEPRTPNPENPPILPMSRSTEDLLASVHLPPRPTDITEETELEALERQFQNLDTDTNSIVSSEPTPTRADFILSSSPATSSGNSSIGLSAPSDPHHLQANLTMRLQPFLASVVPNRHIRLSLFTSPHDADTVPSVTHESDDDDDQHGPLAVVHVVTSPQGAFQIKLNVPWDRISKHPGGVFIAYGDPKQEHKLYILAEMLPVPASSSSSDPPPASIQTTLQVPLTQSTVRVVSDIDDTVKLSNILSGARAVFQNVFVKRLEDLIIPGMSDWYNAIHKRGVHFHYVSNGPFQLLPVISDFIAISSLPEGSIRLRSYAGRSLFNGLLSAPMTRKRAAVIDVLASFDAAQFFLVGDSGEQDLELYAALAAERPQQILAIFIRDASGEDSKAVDDPTGNAVLRSLTGQGITEEPAEISSSYQSQSSASTPSSSSLLSPTDTGVPTPKSSRRWKLPSRSSSATNVSQQDYFTGATVPRAPPVPIPGALPRLLTRGGSLPSPTSETSRFSFGSGNNSTASLVNGMRLPSPRSMQALTSSEKRRMELQMRVYRARALIPEHIPLRIFRDPVECVEAEEILDRMNKSDSAI